MGKRVMLMRAWLEACAHATQDVPEGATLGDVLDELGGPSPGGAAAELGISRQRVHQLIDRGKLDAIYLKDAPRSDPHVMMITEASMKRWKASKPGTQLDLLTSKGKARVARRT